MQISATKSWLCSAWYQFSEDAWLCSQLLPIICMSTAVAVECFHVICNQWKLRDASDFVSYGNGDTQIEQWASSWGAGREQPFWKARGFPAGSHIAPKRVRVCVCALWDKHSCKSSQHTNSYTDTQTGANLWLPLACYRHNGHCLWVFTHTGVIDFQMKRGQKQGRKCCVMICVCVRVNTWLITIYYVFSVG